MWEYSTRWYLSGFSNAVLPYSSSPENKVAAILAWMEHGPARKTDFYSDDAEDRDPVDTLNYKELLSVCGTGTNAFVNLASASGIEARRLLLLDAQGMNTSHVVAEVHLDGRWVIVDPAFHTFLMDSSGHFLTKEELARPGVLQEATRNLAGYDPAYNYEHTAFIHFARLPIVGRFLQTKLNSVLPYWQERINWAVLVERQSNSHADRRHCAALHRHVPAPIDFLVWAKIFLHCDESLGAIDAHRRYVVFRTSRRKTGDEPSQFVRFVTAIGDETTFCRCIHCENC